MNRNYLLGLAFLAMMVVFLVFPNVNFFEKSNTFQNPSGRRMITVESDGTITLVPVKNIDSSINNTVNSLKSELNPLITQNKSLMSANTRAIGITAGGIASNTATFNSYVKKGSQVSMAMGPGNKARFDEDNKNRRFLRGTGDNWRVDYRGSADSEKTGNPPLWIINTV